MKNKYIKSIAGFLASLAFILSAFAPLFSSADIESDPDIPVIFSRSYWGADESLMTWPVEYAKVRKFIIHHTASTTLAPDTDGTGQYKSMVQNIYRFHASSKTWSDGSGTEYTGFGDVGYNYLIDPEGNIYEGRKGGNGAVGGHVTSYNSGTVGISIIGNYQDGAVGQTNTSLDPKVEKAIAKLVGWIAANNGMDINIESNFGGKTIDGLVGHKDVAATKCPGNVMYDQLSAIQADATRYEEQYEKYIYQVRGDSSFYVISGGYKTKFASREDLPSSYRTRDARYISSEQLNAYQYKDLKVLPDGTLIQENGAGTVYYLQGGKRRPLGMGEAEFLRMGFKASDVVNVSTAELDYYALGDLVKFGPDGALIKDSDNNVHFVENGKKRLFTSAALFTRLGYSWTKVKADADANSYLSGDVMRYANGTLVKSAESSNVYYVANGNKRLFTSGALFERLGYKWADILTVSAVELNWYPTGGNMIYADGSLIRGESTPTVYLVSGGQKREITSATLLGRLGYSFASVIEIAQERLSDYPTGLRAVYPDGTLAKSAGSPSIYRILGGKKQEFTSLGVFNAAGAKWSDVIEVSPEELGYYAASGIVKYPDGTLFRSSGGGKIYVIKSGAAVWIQTAEAFTKAGYKWANVITLPDAEFNLYVPVESAPGSATASTATGSTPATTGSAAIGAAAQTGSDTAPTSASEPNIRVAIMGKYADGSLLKATGDGKIYVIKSGQAALINSADEFTAAGYKWDDVATISPKDLAVVLSSNGENTKITANGNYVVEYHEANGGIYKTVQKKSGEVTEVPFIDWEKYIRFVPESDSVILQVLSYHDTFQSGTTAYDDNQFRGVIELRYSPTSKKMWVIEDVPVEGYLRGISEATTRTNAEYLNAFSVITRTYAMNYIVKGGKHAGEPFTLKNSRNGNGNDQQYKGYTFEMRSSGTADSYNRTRGQVIVYGGKPIVAAYSSDSGGVTKSGCTALTSNYCSAEYSYLNGGVKDPASTVHNPAAVAASHGAGMSAAGAYQMAVEGKPWQDIIKYYYPGVGIEKYY